MGRSEGPTQREVLGERFGRVPWRRVLGEAIRGRLGSGPTAVPDRLEGAVFGHLVGAAAAGAADDGASLDLLGRLEALLATTGDEAPGRRPGDGATTEAVATDRRPDVAPAAWPLASSLAVALALRGRDAGVVAARAAATTAGGPTARRTAALHALVARRLIADPRDRRAALRRAERDLRAVADAATGAPGHGRAIDDGTPASSRQRWSTDAASVASFEQGWDAFAGALDLDDAVARAVHAMQSGQAAAIAGGLAGLAWGGAAIAASRRRPLADAARARALVDRLVEGESPWRDGGAWQTSSSWPMAVDLVDLGDVAGSTAGRLGITSLPGRRYVGYHTGAHWRDLDADAARLKSLGFDVLLLLVEDAELRRCRVTGIGEALAWAGVDLVRFPVPDPLLPRDGHAFRRIVTGTVDRLRAGASVAVACRGGLDRAGMATACLLREAGLPGDEAIARVHRTRRGALTLPDQQAYVRGWPPGQ